MSVWYKFLANLFIGKCHSFETLRLGYASTRVYTKVSF